MSGICGVYIKQSAELSRRIVDEAGVNLIDVSSGGLRSEQKIPVEPGYQVRRMHPRQILMHLDNIDVQTHLAEYIKKNVPNVLVGAIGLIT